MSNKNPKSITTKDVAKRNIDIYVAGGPIAFSVLHVLKELPTKSATIQSISKSIGISESSILKAISKSVAYGVFSNKKDTVKANVQKYQSICQLLKNCSPDSVKPLMELICLGDQFILSRLLNEEAPAATQQPTSPSRCDITASRQSTFNEKDDEEQDYIPTSIDASYKENNTNIEIDEEDLHEITPPEPTAPTRNYDYEEEEDEEEEEELPLYEQYARKMAALQDENKEPQRQLPQIDPYKLFDSRMMYPFYPREEVEKIVGRVENALDRPDKFFINRVWYGAQQFYGTDEERDPDTNEIIEHENRNIEGKEVDYQEFLKRVCELAVFDVSDAIENGYVEVEEGRFEVDWELDDLRSLFIIPDFDIRQIGYKQKCRLSLNHFHNIMDGTIPQVISREKEESDKEFNLRTKFTDHDYMKQVIEIGDDNSRANSLTPLEHAMYEFLVRFMKIDEDGNVTGPKDGYLISKQEINQYLVYIYEQYKVSSNDFMSVCFDDAGFNQYGGIRSNERMFRANLVMDWNERRGYKSPITPRAKMIKNGQETEEIIDLK